MHVRTALPMVEIIFLQKMQRFTKYELLLHLTEVITYLICHTIQKGSMTMSVILVKHTFKMYAPCTTGLESTLFWDEPN